MAGLIIDTTVTKKRFTSDLRSQKELLLAAEDKITLMATRVEVIAKEVEVNAEQIALKASSEEVGELTRRMSAAEIAIDGANARIDLKANQTTVDDLGTRVSAAEVAIDGANAEIALKVSKNGVVSAINMSPEGVKISASKIELDGETIANKLLGGYIDVTSIDANEGNITNLYCDTAYLSSLVLNDTGVSLKSKTVVVGQQTLTPSYVTIQYKDHNGNNQYTQVVKSVTINNASTASISYLGT